MATQAVTYSIKEAADELGITERRVRQLIDEGRLSPVEDGMGRQRLTKAAVSNELKRRGRVAIRSLPELDGGTRRDPLLERLDEQSEILRELLIAVQALSSDRQQMGELQAAVSKLAKGQSDIRKAVSRS
jgi:excisionase family DNA binding protein